MSDYQSSVKHICAPAERIFTRLTDLTQLQPVLDKFKDRVPEDKIKIKEITLNADSIYISIDPVGQVGLKIIETEPFKTIKFGADQSPVDFNFWIQLVEKSPDDTKLRLTLRADIPVIIKPMLGGKLEQGIEMVAEALTKIEY